MTTTRSNVRAQLLVVLLAALAMVMALQAAPAEAMTSVGVSADCNEHGQCATGQAALIGATVNPAGGAIEFQCAIEAPGASATAVSRCSAAGYDAPRISLPGPAVATVGFGTVASSQRVEICWEGSATFVLGGGIVETAGCSLININLGDLGTITIQ